jgi:hypothetical protein
MVTVCVVWLPSTAPPPGCDNVIVNSSFDSTVESLRIVIWIVFSVSPMANVSVPLLLVKSEPAAADPKAVA